MRRLMPGLALCALAIVSSGCWNVLSTRPLGDAATEPEIEKLQGVWAWQDVTAFHVKHISGNEFVVAWLEWRDGEYRVTQCKAVVTKDDEKTYLNVVAPTEKEQEQYYIMRLAVFGENTAVLYIPSLQQFAREVDEGAIPGRVERDSRGRPTKVYLRPEDGDLERLVDAARAGVQFDLDHPIVLQRIARSR